ncbi:ABC transporter ATP-binding protein [Paraburkholderia tropica]|uniref:Peptide/nickel transport system ATP-binding protein n=1 Tax=Paraburkholderia tropica TaxID=92647 RepID=A0AAQ1GP38_9BURK|nr:ABC transporter ATP-binding protein [Paraburkholderia tropica]RQN34416.1 ABC transporter ATP-binding protein [Paraburkholderia tropica]SEK15186.1 peptide/nickel transport system ATP-binding protein [Paraburkholderia tropica]
MGAAIHVRDLTIMAGESVLVDRLAFDIAPGQVLALIGESGSGKTTTALALMGYARDGCAIAPDSVVNVGERNVTALDVAAQRALRGRVVTYIAQSASASFNPSRTIMDQVVEPARIHKTMPRAEAEKRAVELFRELALPNPETIGARYPHQVSGGQLQRLMAAMALITDPDLVILDEPTTALDVTTQVEVLRAFRRVVQQRKTSAVYVSHDLAVVAQVADHILVLRHGKMREYGESDQILHAPADDYTRSLLAAARPKERHADAPDDAVHARADAPLLRTDPEGTRRAPQPLLQIDALCAGYGPLDAQGRPQNRILDKVDLKLYRGQAIGVIGESGSGKTTLARAVAGLIAPFEGRIAFDGKTMSPQLDQRSRDELRRIQIVFQIADTALNPAHTIERILARPLQFYHGLQGKALRTRIAQLLDMVRLPRTLMERPPAALSGGQKQRVNLARALAAEPDLLLCDEVTSALDTVVGAAVLDLMADLRKDLGVSYLFISHDLHTVRAICDEIVVMQHGRKVTQVAREDYDRGPHHPYYELLSQSVPELRRGWIDEVQLPKTETVA